ncbi:MAG: phenylalanine--tRNA ligase subunit beta [Chloroflexi bacterium]|nr:phenylalanine--tRNA ligase subunit beta [Chloroflexota bacterium]
MRVPLSWLAEYVPLPLPPAETAHRLTMAGLETTYVPGASAGWDNVVVGNVVDVSPHPNADRLQLATVETGTGTQTVVCGAPNVAVGQRVAFATVGAKLIDGKTGEPMELAAATIRGVESAGMVCSAKELGLGDDHEGILVLRDDAPVGAPLADVLPSDDVLEVEVTPNRGDCLSVLGIAHEIAALSEDAVTEPLAEYDEGDEDVADAITVVVEDAELCVRYTATVLRGVKVGPSPEWMRRRLELAGQRPINNIVDVTNYVMLEYGQPLHAFDLAEFAQATVVVRPARDGERFAALDGVEHTLRPPMLLIADPERAVGLAGVIGGKNSETTATTTDVLVESATFNAINTRRTAAALHIRTEASSRFEKGLNPELAERALRRATALMLETAGGVAARGVSDTYPVAIQAPKILFTGTQMRRVLGGSFPQTQVISVLRSLGFKVDAIDENQLLVVPPYWRTDIAIVEDLIEEVARTVGYDTVPADPLAGRVPEFLPQPERDLREEVRDLLVASGMQDTISYTLVGGADAALGPVLDGSEPLRVANPLSREQEFLRTSLRGPVLRAAATGIRQSASGVALFEIGRIFLPREGDLPEEREIAVGVFAGPRGRSLWDAERALDFYDAKGVVEALIGRLGVSPGFERATDDLLHPGRTASVLANGKPVGIVGELHPRAVASYDLSVDTAAFFELDIGLLGEQVPELRHHFEPISRYPAAMRDLALVVDDDVPAERLQAIIERHPLVVRSTLFDLFSGAGLTAGKRSVAYRLELQSSTGTLGAEELTDAVAAITEQLAKETGATLRA